MYHPWSVVPLIFPEKELRVEMSKKESSATRKYVATSTNTTLFFRRTFMPF